MLNLGLMSCVLETRPVCGVQRRSPCVCLNHDSPRVLKLTAHL